MTAAVITNVFGALVFFWVLPVTVFVVLAVLAAFEEEDR